MPLQRTTPRYTTPQYLPPMSVSRQRIVCILASLILLTPITALAGGFEVKQPSLGTLQPQVTSQVTQKGTLNYTNSTTGTVTVTFRSSFAHTQASGSTAGRVTVGNVTVTSGPGSTVQKGTDSVTVGSGTSITAEITSTGQITPNSTGPITVTGTATASPSSGSGGGTASSPATGTVQGPNEPRPPEEKD